MVPDAEELREDQPGADPTPLERSVGPTLFPRLSAEQYRARVWRYAYIFMRLGFLSLIIGGFWWLGAELEMLLVPLLGSLVLAYLMDPLVARVEARGLSRTVAILICLGVITVLIAVLLLLLIPAMITQAGVWIDEFPSLVETVTGRWIPWLDELVRTKLPEPLRDSVLDYAKQLPSVAERFAGWGLDAVVTTGYLLYALFNFILIPLFTYYFLARLAPLKVAAVDWVPLRRREYTLAVLRRMDTSVSQWFRGQLLVSLIIGVMYVVSLTVVFIIFGIDYRMGIAIGIATGLSNLIPFFGIIVAAILSLLVVLLHWPGWWGLLVIAIVFAVSHVVEAYIISPKILGDSVNLHPILVIILVLVGAQLGGAWGVLLIIPLAGAINVILPDMKLLYHQTTFFHGGQVVYEKEAAPGDEP